MLRAGYGAPFHDTGIFTEVLWHLPSTLLLNTTPLTQLVNTLPVTALVDADQATLVFFRPEDSDLTDEEFLHTVVDASPFTIVVDAYPRTLLYARDYQTVVVNYLGGKAV
jgi:hypothetical protein